MFMFVLYASFTRTKLSKLTIRAAKTIKIKAA